jgi:hypothetical protein
MQFWWRILKERKIWEDLEVDDIIILSTSLRKRMG